MAGQRTFQDGVIENLSKLEKTMNDGLKEVNAKIDNLNNKDITDLKMAMVELKTQVKIYAAIASFIGMALGSALTKFVIK